MGGAVGGHVVNDVQSRLNPTFVARIVRPADEG
jgi:hypothetical protein